MARVVAPYALDDEALGGEVCLRDEVYVALVRDLNRAPELLCEHAARVARGLDGEVKHRKRVDSRQHKDSCFTTVYCLLDFQYRHDLGLDGLARHFGVALADVDVYLGADAEAAFEIDARLD